MPVVELSYSRLQRLVAATTTTTTATVGGRGRSSKKKKYKVKKVTKKEISESLPYLGLDIEGEEGDTVRVEYSPNRPDYSTDIGISLGLQGLLGTKTGIAPLRIKKSKKFSLRVDPSVGKVRPFVTGIIAKGGTIDESLLKQLIVMQEDLHFGIGRKRIKSSIGIHDLDNVDFPLRYATTTDHNYKFVPLNEEKDLTIHEILENTEVGREYGFILGNKPIFPLILDKNQETVSFPPIINAAKTTVTTNTKNIFVEITGVSKTDVEDVLSVIAVTLQTAGFDLESLNISGAKNSTPKLENRKLLFDPSLVNKTIGVKLPVNKITSSLKKSRLDAKEVRRKRIECTVPRYRFDIFGPMDLVEEVVLGYGVQNIAPQVSPSDTLGKRNDVSSKLKTLTLTMIGAGCLEGLNSCLTGRNVLYDATNRSIKDEIAVLDSKSQEHTVLRDMLTPQLLDSLSKNIHEPYPQRLFEIGTTFKHNNPIREETNLACVIAHKGANFTEAKSVVQSVLKNSFDLKIKTKTSSDLKMLEDGHQAAIEANNKKIGFIGEVSSSVLDNFRIRVPVVAFEISLSGLIFD